MTIRNRLAKLSYLTKRRLHFASGFIVRNAGEIGGLLLALLLFVLVLLTLEGKDVFGYFIGLAPAIIAYGAFLTQQRSKMKEVIDSLDASFRNLLPERIQFGKVLRRKKSTSWSNRDDSIDDILDFFDTIGFFVRTGALSFVLADEAFAYSAIRYLRVCKKRIDYRQSIDELAYGSFVWFEERLAIKGTVDESALQEFIEEEATYNPRVMKRGA